jgi:hypothetical protein
MSYPTYSQVLFSDLLINPFRLRSGATLSSLQEIAKAAMQGERKIFGGSELLGLHTTAEPLRELKITAANST